MSPPLHILIVEDEILIALELETLLQDLGHHCVGVAGRADEALQLAAEHGPDLALVDIHLADGPRGVEVGRELACGGRTAVLFMTANAKRIPADFAGALGVIPKPYSERAVRDALGLIGRALAGDASGLVPDGVTLAPDFDALVEERAHGGRGPGRPEASHSPFRR